MEICEECGCENYIVTGTILVEAIMDGNGEFVRWTTLEAALERPEFSEKEECAECGNITFVDEDEYDKKMETSKYFILNECGKFEFIGEFGSFDEADNFVSSDKFSGMAIWVFDEESFLGLSSSFEKVKEKKSDDINDGVSETAFNVLNKFPASKKIEIAHRLIASEAIDAITVEFFNLHRDSDLMFELDWLPGREKMISIDDAIDSLKCCKIPSDKGMLRMITRLRDIGIHDIVIGS